jgi:hypothetical protein
MSLFMSDPHWHYEDPSGLPDFPGERAPRGQVRVVREPRRTADVRTSRRLFSRPKAA